MRNNFMRKFISCVLVAVMVLTPSVPSVVYAAAPEDTVTDGVVMDTETPDTGSVESGNTVVTETETENTEPEQKQGAPQKKESEDISVMPSEDDGQTSSEKKEDGIVVSDEETPVAKTVQNTVDATDISGVKVSVVRKSDNEQMYRNTDLSAVVANLDPGTYNLTIESVPKGYFIIKAENEIEVTQKGSKDPFRIAVGTTEIWVKVYDKDKGTELSGVKGSLINERGSAVYENVNFPIHTGTNQPLAPGEYTIHITSVPAGYVAGEDKVITVQSTTDAQTFSTSVGHTKINLHAVNDATDRDLTDVKVDIVDSRGGVVVSDVKLPFNVTTSDKAAYVAPGTYTVKVKSVPDGYVKPTEDVKITVKEQEKEQNFEIRLKKTSITVRAQDITSKKELQNVAVTVLNAEGEIIKTDADLRYVENYLAPGTYKLRVTSVPDGYALPKEQQITIQATDKKQVFLIDLDYTKVNIMAVDKETGNPVSVVRATLVNSNGHNIWANQSLAKLSDHLVPGSYTIKTNSVPDGYILPGDKTVTVKQTADKQTFKVTLDYTKVKFGAKDKTTGKDLSGVKATIYDPSGKAVVRDTDLVYARERLATGKYTVHVTKVPEGYATPADKSFTIENKADLQTFKVDVDTVKTKVHFKDKDTGKYIGQKISMHFENSNGRAVAIYTTDSGWKQIDKVPAGSYKAIFDVVPSSYKKPATQTVKVKDYAGLQNFTFKLELRHQILLAKAKAGNKALAIGGNKINGADGYDIYIVRCGNNFKSKPTATIYGNSNFSFKKEGLKNHKEYKVIVKAWHYVNGAKKTMATAPCVHSIVKNTMNGYVNAKSVIIKSKKSISLKKGKTAKIKAKVNKLKKDYDLFYKKHTSKLRYYSSNKSVATVNSAGKVTGRNKGQCDIYVLATNGVRKSVKVTVK